MNPFRLLRQLKKKLLGYPDVGKLVRNGLELGSNVHIGPGVIIDPAHCWLISIGDHCTFAPRVHILAHDASTKRHLGYTRIGLVHIGDRTFVGAGTIILPGVTIGRDVIIGAGSVVTKDVPDGSVAVGNPAVVVGLTTEYIERNRARMATRPTWQAAGWTIDTGITQERKVAMRDALKDGIGYLE